MLSITSLGEAALRCTLRPRRGPLPVRRSASPPRRQEGTHIAVIPAQQDDAGKGKEAASDVVEYWPSASPSCDSWSVKLFGKGEEDEDVKPFSAASPCKTFAVEPDYHPPAGAASSPRPQQPADAKLAPVKREWTDECGTPPLPGPSGAPLTPPVTPERKLLPLVEERKVSVLDAEDGVPSMEVCARILAGPFT